MKEMAKAKKQQQEQYGEGLVCKHKWELSIYCEYCCKTVENFELKGFHYRHDH